MSPDLHQQITNLIYSAIPVIVVFGIGVIAATWLQELVRKWFRNGKGNRRDDTSQKWPTEMLLMLGGMNKQLEDIHHVLSNGINQDIRDMKSMLENLKGK